MVALVILQAGDEGGHEDEQGIIKNMIEKPLKPPARYYNCVASISNSWRATGNPKVVEDAAAQEHGAGAARKFFSKAPGRCLRARWLSVEAVEKTIANGANLIGTVWSRLWGHTLPEGVSGARPAVEKKRGGEDAAADADADARAGAAAARPAWAAAVAEEEAAAAVARGGTLSCRRTRMRRSRQRGGGCAPSPRSA